MVGRAYSYSGYKFHVHLNTSYILSLIMKRSIGMLLQTKTCVQAIVCRQARFTCTAGIASVVSAVVKIVHTAGQ